MPKEPRMLGHLVPRIRAMIPEPTGIDLSLNAVISKLAESVRDSERAE